MPSFGAAPAYDDINAHATVDLQHAGVASNRQLRDAGPAPIVQGLWLRPHATWT
jgi:hypothetical protein